MKQWLIVLTEDNWKIGIDSGLIGLSASALTRCLRIEIGDRLWIYVSTKFSGKQTPRVQAIRGAADITGRYQQLQHSPWPSNAGRQFVHAWPTRIHLQCDLPGREIVRQLSFCEHPEQWGAYLQNVPLKLNDSDAELIMSRISEVRLKESSPAPMS